MATFTATVQTGKVSGTNSNFPAYVNLANLPIAFWNTVTNGGGDIRVYTNSTLTTEIAREVVSCDTATDTGELWCKVGSMTSSTQVWITVDGTSADYAVTATYGRNAVWSDNAAVWHLNEYSAGSSAVTRVDSKGNNNLTDTNTVASGTGKLGLGASFIRTNSEYLTITDANQTGLDITSTITLQAWVNLTSAIAFSSIIYKGLDTTGNERLNYAIDLGSDGISPRFVYISNNTYHVYDFGQNLTTGTWYHLAVSFTFGTGSSVKTYINGSATSGGSWVAGSGVDIPVQNAFDVYVGRVNNASPIYFNGAMDEVNVMSAIKSADHISTEYQNQNDNSAFWGTWSEVSGVTNQSNFFLLF